MTPTLEITTILPCANFCKFCPQDKLRQNYKGQLRLTYDEFKMVLDKIPRYVRIDFSAFSEPFLNRESSLMMHEAHLRGYEVALFTSLVGFTKRDLDIIEFIDFDHCTIHVPDDVNFITNEKKWIEAYRLFASYMDIDAAYFHIGNLSGAVDDAVPRARNASILNRANNVSSSIAAPSPKKTGPVSCPMTAEFNQNVMLPNGDVYLCCMDWGLQHKLGNLFTDTYESLFQSEEYKNILRAAADDSYDLLCRWCVR